MDSYTKFPNNILECVLSEKLSAAQLTVILYVLRNVNGWNKDSNYISVKKMSEMTGYSRNALQAAISKLEENGLLNIIRSKKGAASKMSLSYSKSEQGCQAELSRGVKRKSEQGCQADLTGGCQTELTGGVKQSEQEDDKQSWHHKRNKEIIKYLFKDTACAPPFIEGRAAETIRKVLGHAIFGCFAFAYNEYSVPKKIYNFVTKYGIAKFKDDVCVRDKYIDLEGNEVDHFWIDYPEYDCGKLTCTGCEHENVNCGSVYYETAEEFIKALNERNEMLNDYEASLFEEYGITIRDEIKPKEYYMIDRIISKSVTLKDIFYFHYWFGLADIDDPFEREYNNYAKELENRTFYDSEWFNKEFALKVDPLDEREEKILSKIINSAGNGHFPNS